MQNNAKKITRAVIPAAGLGTRMLPISKSVPKEMLPIVDRPAISYLVEEAINAGITDILIITGRDKYAIENYFDRAMEYEYKFEHDGKFEELERLREISKGANIYYIRQKETKGLGHAILCAKSFTCDEPFAVMYGDDVIISKRPVISQLEEAYCKYGLATAGVKAVPEELVMKYCTLDAKPNDDGTYHVTNMIEKPKKEQIITNFSILGRVILTPEIYDILAETPLGAGGELQLTDAMGTLSRTKGMTAVDFEGERFDIGAKIGLLKANVTQGVVHPETGKAFTEWLKDFVKTL